MNNIRQQIELQNLIPSGNWMVAPKVLAKLMPLDAAWYFAHLMELSNSYQAWQKGNGFFYHTFAKMTTELDISEKTQRRLDGLLVELELLEVTTMRVDGSPDLEKKRHLRVDFVRFRQLANQTLSGDIPYRQEGDETYLPAGDETYQPIPAGNTIPKLNKTIRNTGEGADAPVPPVFGKPMGMDVTAKVKKTPTAAMFHFESRLRTILRQRTDWPVSNGTRLHWAGELQVLANRLGGDTDQIENLLDWMEVNIKSIKRPSITCAKQFVQHFGWLTDIMNKAKKDPKSLFPDPTDLPESSKHTVIEMRSRRVQIIHPGDDSGTGYTTSRLAPTKVTYAIDWQGSKQVWREYSVEGSDGYPCKMPVFYEPRPPERPEEESPMPEVKEWQL